MPKKYTAMRDEFIKQGASPKNAKAKAARIYNAQRKPGMPPVTSVAREPAFRDTDTRERSLAGAVTGKR